MSFIVHTALGGVYGKPQQRSGNFVQISLGFATAEGQTVLNKLKPGQLNAVRVRVGTRSAWPMTGVRKGKDR